MKAALYVRVSTADQVNEGYSLSAQERALNEYVKSKGWTIHRIYRDKGVSGRTTDRLEFKKLMDAAQRGMFEVVVVYKLDRFGRSLKDLITSINNLKDWGVDFVSLGDSIDTSTATGKLTFHIIGAIAEFESSLISERTKAGMEEAKRQGKHVGRPKTPSK